MTGLWAAVHDSSGQGKSSLSLCLSGDYWQTNRWESQIESLPQRQWQAMRIMRLIQSLASVCARAIHIRIAHLRPPLAREINQERLARRTGMHG